MRAVCDDAATLQNMLDFEAALARAEAAAGVIPAGAAGPIAKACKAESFEIAALAEAATRSGNLAIPLVKALTANVAKASADAARHVHWGATSQDVIDTATMMMLRAGIDALLGDIERALIDIELDKTGPRLQLTEIRHQVAQAERRVNVFGVERGQHDVRHGAKIRVRQKWATREKSSKIQTPSSR